MHVLILPSWYFPADSNEIRGRMFQQHAKALQKKGIEARILFAEFNADSPFKMKMNYAVEEGIPTWRARQWYPPKVHSLLIRLWIKKYAALIHDYIQKEGRPDIIHAQSYLTGIIAARIFQKTSIPFIVTERLSSFITGKIPGRYKPFIKKTFDEARQITCVSPGLKKKIQLYTSKNIEVVPNFFDPVVFYHDPLVRKNEIFTWVSVGEPSYIKGLDRLVHAFGQARKILPSVKMQLILIDNIREKEELIKIADEYQITDDIIWTGLISQTEIADILRNSHVFVSASRVETFGKSILEAQACGLPVVATSTDGASYIMSHPDQGIVIPNHDTGKLMDALHEMCRNYNLYNAEKITTSVTRFRQDTIIEQWLDIYHKIAG